MIMGAKIHCQKAGDPGQPMVWFQSNYRQAENPRRASVTVQVQRQGNDPVSQLKTSQAGGVRFYLRRDETFCSVQVFD